MLLFVRGSQTVPKNRISFLCLYQFYSSGARPLSFVNVQLWLLRCCLIALLSSLSIHQYFMNSHSVHL